MSLLDRPETLVALLNAAAHLLAELRQARAAAAHWLRGRGPAVSYANPRLDLVLAIGDARGARAVLTRRQRVEFLVEESGVVRDLVGGEGEVLAGYRTDGARRLLVRPEGSTIAVLLGLGRPPAKGECATISSRRVIRGGLVRRAEYLEARVERPTGRLTLKVIFPRSRPPRAAVLVTVPTREPSRPIPVRTDRAGRPVVSWSITNPVRDRVYSLRWSW